jgi:hypothetical protein
MVRYRCLELKIHAYFLLMLFADYTMTYIQNFSLEIIVSSVPYVLSYSIPLKIRDFSGRIWEVRICIDNNEL